MFENKPLPESVTQQPDALSGIFSRNPSVSLRTKLFAAITTITSIAVLALGYFSYSRAMETQTYLHNQLQSNIVKQAEYQLQTTTIASADQLSQYLNSITDDLMTETKYFENIQNQFGLFSSGSYWDARQKLNRLSSGQWDNPNSDNGAILVPSSVQLNDEKVAEINSFIFLDFFAPEMLTKENTIIATYFIDPDGVTIYYPNNDLANLMGDFNSTSQPFYQSATPENNKLRLPAWSVPYQDPNNKGLIITNSIPVYDKQDKFLGILGADILLSGIETRIANIKAGDSGFAFLIDRDGQILALPPRAYADLGLSANDFIIGKSIQQSNLGQGPEALQGNLKNMIAGQDGIAIALINNKEYYFAYAPVTSSSFRLGILVPTAELNAASINIDTELNNQTRQTNNIILFLIGTILITAGIAGWSIGRLLASPLSNLTIAAQKIASGDLAVKANADSNDEIGILGNAFNNMTTKLSDSISNLETRVAERTNEITITNEKYQKQAAQLVTIAEIARASASLKKLDELLPEITRNISTAFGFYHVGIFLVDVNREYAVLKAANSQGGQRMLARNHRLKIGQVGIVGFVTQTGESRIALDVGDDAFFFTNPDLPETHSELALPLRVGEKIIGALDVQSQEIAAFTSQDIDNLGLLADQISVAIENARLFDELHISLLESQTTYSQSALASWREINRLSSTSGFRYFNGAIEPLRNETKKVETNIQDGSLSIPINFRGQQLGALNIRQPGRTLSWSAAEIRPYQSIVERLSFALENARLYIDAQKRAAKEQIIGEIGAKISGSINLDNILQIVVEELGRTIPGSEVSIQLEEDSLNPNLESGQTL